MAYIPRSSFGGQIPGVIPMQVQQKRTIRIFSVLSTAVLILSLLGSIGSYAYKRHLNTRLSNAQSELNARNDSSVERKMLELQMYDRKLNIARTLLDNHVAVSRIFDVLEDSTKQTIRLISLEYEYDPGYEAEITLGGDTRELKSVALQKLQIINEDIFSDFIVREVSTADVIASKEREKDSTPKDDDEEKDVISLGVGFEVAGLFKKEVIEFEGGHDGTQIYSIPQDFAIPTGGMNQSGDTATPATSTSNNDMRL